MSMHTAEADATGNEEVIAVGDDEFTALAAFRELSREWFEQCVLIDSLSKQFSGRRLSWPHRPNPNDLLNNECLGLFFG